MRTTVKLGIASQIEVAPIRFCDNLSLELMMGEARIFVSLTSDQAGALIFGMEQALEVIDQRHRAQLDAMREAA